MEKLKKLIMTNRGFVMLVCMIIGAITLFVENVIAAEKKIHLKDYINHTWSNELVTYYLEFEPGTCHQSSIELIAPEYPIPFQISEARADEGDYLRSARLSFITDLPALGEKVFTLRYDKKTGHTTDLPKTDLCVKRGENYIEFTTERAGVRLLCGKKRYPETEAAGNVPGPVIGFRTLEGTWISGSSLYGNRKIVSWESMVEAMGPVFAKACIKYTYETGDTLIVKVKIVAGQEVVFLESKSSTHTPEDGWQLNLSHGFASPVLSVRSEYDNNKWGLPGGDKMGEIGHGELSREKDGVMYYLVPWEDWWDGMTGTVFSLHSPESKTVLSVGSYDPGVWNDPAWIEPNKRYQYPFIPESHWERRVFKAMALVKGSNGETSLQCSTHIGERKWFVGFVPKNDNPDQSYMDAVALHDEKYGCQSLDMVKDYVLDWQRDPEIVYPRLYVSSQNVVETRRKFGDNREAIESQFYRYYRMDTGERWRVSGRELMQYMVNSAYYAPLYTMTLEGNPNKFDLMRHSPMLVNLFDILMGIGKLSESEQKLLRAQIAFLGYSLDNPYVWDMERGYAGDPNNMHISYMCNLGLVACVIPDHPMAKAWANKAIKWVKTRMSQCVDKGGVWTVENLHYANVSLSPILPFAIAAQNAGFYDFLKDKELRSWAMYVVKQLTPRDPRYENVRSQPPEQYEDRAERTGLAGLIAKATAYLDPEYSKVMQWAWNEQGNPVQFSNAGIIGFESIMLDKSLPATQPRWKSEHFPNASVILRHGLGTSDEAFLALATRQYGDYYLSQPGGVTIYAKGKPLAMIFAGSYEVCTSESFLSNCVNPARIPGSIAERTQNRGYFDSGEVQCFSAMPRQDYVSTTFMLKNPRPVRSFFNSKLPSFPKTWPRILKQAKNAGVIWKRQVLFMKGARANDGTYFIFRDTIKGGQPTVWSMWTLSQKIGTPDEAKNLKTFLADAPENNITFARELAGNRFTAVGQFDVDMEYYIALPTDTPRATLRWGYSTTAYWPNPWHEYQDLLHLQRIDDGPYYVVFFPRRRSEPSPEFSTLGNGMIIKTKGTFGTDYCFLSAEPVRAVAEAISFNGESGSVQDRTDCIVLSLGAKGEVCYKDYRLASAAAANVEIMSNKLTLSSSHDRLAPQAVTLDLPAGYSLSPLTKNVQLRKVGESKYDILIPENVSSVTLQIHRM